MQKILTICLLVLAATTLDAKHRERHFHGATTAKEENVADPAPQDQEEIADTSAIKTVNGAKIHLMGEEESCREVMKAESEIVSSLLQEGRLTSLVHYFNSLTAESDEPGPEVEEVR